MNIIPVGCSAERVADVAREMGLPGVRSKTAIARIRRARAAASCPVVTPSLMERLNAQIVARYVPEIGDRGGAVRIYDKTASVGLSVRDRGRSEAGRRLYLLGADGWRYYSRRVPSRYVSLRYLVGQDDNGPFAVRVPGTVGTVAEAVAALLPAQVRQRIEQGRRVARQGDVYAVETTPAHDTATGWVDADRTHWWDADTRYLTHRPATGRKHRPVKFTAPVRFVAQNRYNLGGCGD